MAIVESWDNEGLQDTSFLERVGENGFFDSSEYQLDLACVGGLSQTETRQLEIRKGRIVSAH